jgi:hypothetical protein
MPSKAKITIIKRNGMFQVSNVFLPDELYVRFSSHEAIAHVANDIFVEDPVIIKDFVNDATEKLAKALLGSWLKIPWDAMLSIIINSQGCSKEHANLALKCAAESR